MNDDTRTLFDQVRTPVFERAGLGLSAGLLVAGAAVLALVLSGVLHSAASPVPVPPPIAAAPTPVPGLSVALRSAPSAIVADPPARQQRADRARFAAQGMTHIPAAWESGFYRLYDTASRAFGVNWLLLASIHKQETAFSTSPSTYHGLNFAGCCGGPMQFNVTNGPVTTWRRVRDSFRYAVRPAAYNHPTTAHPSIYDDFDSLMAASRLLASDGAGAGLDGSAWQAAYDYYGHDATGVTYADQVLARAISWSQHGFCINCGLDPAMVDAVHGAYAPVVATPAPAATPLALTARAGSERRPRGHRSG